MRKEGGKLLKPSVWVGKSAQVEDLALDKRMTVHLLSEKQSKISAYTAEVRFIDGKIRLSLLTVLILTAKHSHLWEVVKKYWKS